MLGRVPRTTNGLLAPGSAGTMQTVAMMRRLALDGSGEPVVRRLAQRIVTDAGTGGNVLASVLALFRWVRDRVRFAPDPHGLERIQAPWVTIARMSGDCDDKATLLASLIRAAGLRVPLSFRVIAADPRRPLDYSHVYLIVRATRPLALDATHAGTRAGWQFPAPARLADFAV